MKKFIIILLTLSCSIMCLQAQKLVAGSNVEPFKKTKGVFWVGKEYSPAKNAILIDFYSSNNPSSVSMIEKYIDNIYDKAKTFNVDIIILSATNDDEFQALAEKYEDVFYFGVDTRREVFDKFSVLYVPFSVLVDSDSKLVWQGNLSTLNDQAIKDLR